jgi:formylglycine-generating enzyme required for sulfatase activity
MQRWFALLVLLTGIHQVFAQNLEMRVVGTGTIESGTIISRQKVDINGMPVAGIRIITTLQGLKFDSNNGIVGPVESGPGYYLLYLSTTERKIKVFSPNHKPLDIILSDVGIRLKAQEVWRLEITGDRKIEAIPVTIRTKPADAVRFIDGENKGTAETIPLELGKHKLRLEKEGYKTLEKEIEVTATKAFFEETLKEVELQTVTIRSEPKGATIFLNGVDKGKTDKQLFLYPGLYTIKWTLPDYLDIEQQIELKENTDNIFTTKMIKNTGFISWSVTPSDAVMKVNGQVVTERSLERPPGTYTLTAEKSGYLPFSEIITLERGKTVTKNVMLEKSTGSLTWTVNPAGAKVLINREDYSNRTAAELAPGRYLVELSAEGYDPQTETVELKRNETLRKTWVLTMQTGSIQVLVEPIDAKLSLFRNNVLVQSWTGAKILKNLQVGEYILKAELNGYETWSKTLTLAKEKTETLDITLKPAPMGASVTRNATASAGATYTNSIGMEFVLIPAGTFQMGSNDGEDDEKPVHSVTISKPFYLGKYEVTQREWKAVMGSNPSYYKGDNRPVERVSWDDVQEFIKKLNAKEGGDKYRLPTEAEWEYACRAGSTTRWYFGDNENQLGDYAWYKANSGNETKPVGQKKPNAFGLYDMHGNVWEWCQDWYSKDYYGSSPKTDPTGPSSGSNRVRRGGSWGGTATIARAALRGTDFPDYRYGNLGFRLLRLQ